MIRSFPVKFLFSLRIQCTVHGDVYDLPHHLPLNILRMVQTELKSSYRMPTANQKQWKQGA